MPLPVHGYHRRRGLRFFILIIVAAASAAAFADPPPPGAVWTETYIDEADGTQLYADVLRTANLPTDAKTPVILSIGPYFNHSGQVGPAGPAEKSTRSRHRPHR